MEAGLLEAQDPLTEEESKSCPPPPASTGIIDGITCDILQVVMVVITFCMSHGLSRGLYPLVLLDAAGGSVSKAAYLQGGIMFGVHGLGFLIANPIFATLSDYSDKRKFLVLSLVGNAVEALIITQNLGLEWIIFGAAVRGITSCFIAVAASGIAELSSNADRGKNLALIGVAFGLGLSIGQFIGGYVGEQNILYPFYLAAAVNVFGILWTMLFVPALASHSRMTSITAAMNPFKNMSILWETPALRVLSTVFTFQVIGATFGHSIWVLYLRYRFGWDPVEYGNFMFVFGMCVVFCQLVVVRVIFSTIGESRCLLTLMIIRVVESALIPFISEGWYLYPVAVVASVGFLTWPTLRSLISRQVDMDKQGQAMGAMGCLATLAEMLSELASNSIFGLSVEMEQEQGFESGSTPISGISFWVAAGFLVVGTGWWACYGNEVDSSEKEVDSMQVLKEQC